MSETPSAAGGMEPSAASLLVGGITSFSTVDWPGRLVATCWLVGCPWRCSYCQNRILWERSAAESSFDELLELLEARQGLLDGVVFSGGEPLAQPGLAAAMRAVRELGFDVGLHTGGAVPERLAEVLPLVDWVGFDVKAPWDAYERITLVPGSGERARESLGLVLASGVDMEARTTWHPSLLSQGDIRARGEELRRLGVPHWAVQAYREEGTDGSLPAETAYPSDVPEDVRALVPSYEFRRA